MSRELLDQGAQIFIPVMLAVLTVWCVYARRQRKELVVAIHKRGYSYLLLLQLPLFCAWFGLWLVSGRPLSLSMLNVMSVFFVGVMAWLERYRPINGLSQAGVVSYGVLTPWSSIKSYEFVENVLQMRLSHMRAKMRIPTADLPIAKQLLASVDGLIEARRPESTASLAS